MSRAGKAVALVVLATLVVVPAFAQCVTGGGDDGKVVPCQARTRLYGPLVSQETAARAAYDAYRRFHPYEQGFLVGGQLLLGNPWQRKPVASEWTEQECAWAQNGEAIPFYRFTVTNRASDPQEIDVNAMDGHAMSIGYTMKLGIILDLRPLIRASDLDSVCLLNGVATGKMVAQPGSSKDRPAGTPLVFASGRLVFLGVLDSGGQVWVKQVDSWNPFRVEGALAGEVAKAAQEEVRPFGGPKPDVKIRG